jgi:D-alanine--poly(phosphoribitol) ligase subunit 2
MEKTHERIHAKIVELASQSGHDAGGLRPDEDIPASGLLDSPALIELIVWCETEFRIVIDQEHLTLDNFGTVDAMCAYIGRRRAGVASAG